ncbi:hypothetical protein AAFN85_21050 [Mucilaginibacter sp. CAU 1740]|uniref:hypothetical protein n=1 Tax=Mucilaginibacter sp. CAU 1740 TaxID=3140365 RepID=UPI00325AC4C9
MDFQKQLFFLKTQQIKIEINLGWKDNTLILEGYDIGTTVENFHGDSDYEYNITVKDAELEKLYHLNNVEVGQKLLLVETIAQKINGNKSYSEFQKYLKENGIGYEAFTW